MKGGRETAEEVVVEMVLSRKEIIQQAAAAFQTLSELMIGGWTICIICRDKDMRIDSSYQASSGTSDSTS